MITLNYCKYCNQKIVVIELSNPEKPFEKMVILDYDSLSEYDEYLLRSRIPIKKAEHHTNHIQTCSHSSNENFSLTDIPLY